MKNKAQAFIAAGLMADILPLMQSDFVIEDEKLYKILEDRLNIIEAVYADATGFKKGSEEDKAFKSKCLTTHYLTRALLASDEQTEAKIQAILNEADSY